MALGGAWWLAGRGGGSPADWKLSLLLFTLPLLHGCGYRVVYLLEERGTLACCGVYGFA